MVTTTDDRGSGSLRAAIAGNGINQGKGGAIFMVTEALAQQANSETATRYSDCRLEHSLASGCGTRLLNRAVSTRSDGDAVRQLRCGEAVRWRGNPA